MRSWTDRMLWATGVWLLCVLSLIFVSALLSGCGGPAFETRQLEQPSAQQDLAPDAKETPARSDAPTYQLGEPNADAGIGGEQAGAAGSRGQDAAPAAGGSDSASAGGTHSVQLSAGGQAGAPAPGAGGAGSGGAPGAGGTSAGAGGAPACSYEQACHGRQCDDQVACGGQMYRCACSSCTPQPSGSVQQALCVSSYGSMAYVVTCPSSFPGSPQGGPGPLPGCQELPRYAGVWCCPS